MPRRRLCTIGIVGIWLSLSLGLARAALLSLGAESGWTGRTKQLQSLGNPGLKFRLTTSEHVHH